MNDDRTSDRTVTTRRDSCSELMFCQQHVPPEVELQPDPLPDACENSVGVVHGFKLRPELDDYEAGVQSAAARHTANTCAAEQYPIRHAPPHRTRRNAAMCGANSCVLEHDGGRGQPDCARVPGGVSRLRSL